MIASRTKVSDANIAVNVASTILGNPSFVDWVNNDAIVGARRETYNFVWNVTPINEADKLIKRESLRYTVTSIMEKRVASTILRSHDCAKKRCSYDTQVPVPLVTSAVLRESFGLRRTIY